LLQAFGDLLITKTQEKRRRKNVVLSFIFDLFGKKLVSREFRAIFVAFAL